MEMAVGLAYACHTNFRYLPRGQRVVFSQWPSRGSDMPAVGDEDDLSDIQKAGVTRTGSRALSGSRRRDFLPTGPNW